MLCTQLSTSVLAASSNARAPSSACCRARRRRHSAAREARLASSATVPYPQQSLARRTPAVDHAGLPASLLGASCNSAYANLRDDFGSGRSEEQDPNQELHSQQAIQLQGRTVPSDFSPTNVLSLDPSVLLMGDQEHSQVFLRGYNSFAWPFVRARPTRSIGSMAGFANKVSSTCIVMRLHLLPATCDWLLK